ncbi:serine hydrolase [Thermomonospora umbrina]|uniref:CubicO group peptidase (Beta-lactamase class C family) n=1 Tax=Thermomonospora umbrina TaxID=111806 RepID=A0A3D9TA22_9ACTN|nr:serine hydrolase [Thermomonospora umbrina]REF00622.1 CubicO group peptidase (beta-lactamase class C family) [Thermomonospora umbrina]
MRRSSKSWRPRRVVASAIGLAVGLSLGVVPAQAVPGVPSAVFDPNSVRAALYRDELSGDFGLWNGPGRLFDRRTEQNLMVVDLDIESNGTVYRVGSVWQENIDGRTWKLERDLDDMAFAAAAASAQAANLRMVDQESYLVGGQRRYAGVWVENREGLNWEARRDMDRPALDAFTAAKRAAHLPIDIDQYMTSAGVRWSAVWVENTENLTWHLEPDMSSADVSARFTEYAAFRMLGLNSTPTATNGQRYAGIWVANRNGRGSYMFRDMTSKRFSETWNRMVDEGFRIVAFDRYETAAGTRYAGVWRQDSARHHWAYRVRLNERIQKELEQVPGVSVAVYENGDARYQRGFGHADIANDVPMDSGHVGDLASTSKAVAGVLTMKMVEAGQVNLSTPTRTYVPTMPGHHTHTIGQLLSNRGCVRNYINDQGETWDDTPYASALDASRMFWNDGLVCTPPTYHYSTHGYTLLGAALEAADPGTENIRQVVLDRLTTPHGLETLRPSDLSRTGVRRMTQYNGDDEVAARDIEDWKTLGGGMESNVVDLARFGDKLVRDQIIRPESQTAMWTRPDNHSSNYAYGWNVDTVNGRLIASKPGRQEPVNSAYLEVHPTQNITIAVLVNTGIEPNRATALGQCIRDIIMSAPTTRVACEPTPTTP